MKKQKAFTIVELLIVIVVIGILAAISLVAYSSTQQRARDSDRKSDITILAKAFAMYKADTGTAAGAGSGCGSGGNGAGWVHHDYDGTGPYKSMMQCLIDGGYLKENINDPHAAKGCTLLNAGPPSENECFYYMKYECNGGTYLFANLEQMPWSTTDVNDSCTPGLDSSYGMNYFIQAT
jgi:prepilin-type N-terminal cleavage/methylation domain-containing protein